MGNMPTISVQNIIDRKGSALLEANFSDEMIFIPHSGNTDFGIDYSVELTDVEKKCTLGHFVSVQLKTHQQIVFDLNGDYYQSVKINTINYWLNVNMPVIMVLVDLSTGTIYGIDAKKTIRSSFDHKKMKTQSTISLKVHNNDLFAFGTCLRASVEYEKYRVLLSSAIDSYNIYNFLNYISEYSNRDWFSLVDDYQDLTREILSFSDKYSVPFCLDSRLEDLRKKMVDTIKNNLNNGLLDYDEYTEQVRTQFNKCAEGYFFELTKKICEEIDLDKTFFLKKQLFKFKRLNLILEDYGKIAWREKWNGYSLNALNCDYDFDEFE